MRKLVLALIAAGVALSAVNAKVTTDSSPSANFSTYKSFYWAHKPEGGSPIMMQRIVDGINARLQAKGWTLAEGSGDVALAAHVSSSEKQSLDTFYSGTAMGGWGWRGWGGYGTGTATTTVRNYTVGTLVIDMFDARTQQAVWRGTTSGTLSSPERTTKMLNKDLDNMFAKFPPAG